MADSMLIKNGTVYNPCSGKEEKLDLRIKDGIIHECAAKLEHSDKEDVFDASGLIVSPGLIDLHTHLRDLGQKDKEDINTGTKAAAAGGYTTLIAMANTVPTIDSPAVMALLLKRIAENALVEVLPVASVTRNLAGQELTNMYELAEMGAVAFSDDGVPVGNLSLLRRALEHSKLTGKIIISHPEDKELSAGGIIRESITSTKMGLAGIPDTAETVAVAKEIEIVRLTKTPYHFTHVSCARSVELVRRAKQDGLPITCDTTPHHIALSVEDIPGYDSSYKMNPPLQTAEDRQAVIAGILDGTIDAIATDHAPHTKLEKSGTMEEAPCGVIGLETAYAVCNQVLVKENGLSQMKFLQLLTSRPAKVLALAKPELVKGAVANLTVIDPQCKWQYDAEKGISKSSNSPFSGKEMTGKILLTIYRGKRIFIDSESVKNRQKGAEGIKS